MTAIIDSILSFFSLVGVLAGGALGLEQTAFMTAASGRAAVGAALFIAFLSGVSEMIGQSIVLVINRVPVWRFLASLVFTGVIYLVAALAWGASVLVAAPFFRAEIIEAIGYGGLFAVIAMSFAPRLLGVLVIAPYFGIALGQMLDAWVMAAVIFGLHAATGLPIEAAALCGVLGWSASFVIRALLGRFLRTPLRALRLAVSGSPLELTPQQFARQFVERAREGFRP
ncbi:MAG: hypothetical protein AAGJ87_03410 [Pseudomonadota bacterium]